MRLPNLKDTSVLKTFGVRDLSITETIGRYNRNGVTNNKLKKQYICRSTLYKVLQRLVKSGWLCKDIEKRITKYGLSLKGVKAFEMIKEIERIFK